jgi:hypothetical protein
MKAIFASELLRKRAFQRTYLLVLEYVRLNHGQSGAQVLGRLALLFLRRKIQFVHQVERDRFWRSVPAVIKIDYSALTSNQVTSGAGGFRRVPGTLRLRQRRPNNSLEEVLESLDITFRRTSQVIERELSEEPVEQSDSETAEEPSRARGHTRRRAKVWGPEETLDLIAGTILWQGTHWTSILRDPRLSFFHWRTTTSLKNKWRGLNTPNARTGRPAIVDYREQAEERANALRSRTYNI